MNKLFEIATKISSGWSLAAFAIIALVLLVIKLKGRKVPSVAWAVVVAVVVVALAPIIAPVYMNSYGVFRVRVVVLDEHQIPTNEAKVTCSVGGEVKKVEGGWECDIPSKTKPADGKMQAYASIENAFLTGRAELELKDDYNPVATINLAKDNSAKIIGMVVDEHETPIAGVRIGVVGYESEVWTTQNGGNFSLLAHAAQGQQVQLSASKDGYTATTEWHQAGDFPTTIRLHKQQSAKQKS
jgi:hypothetical protein